MLLSKVTKVSSPPFYFRIWGVGAERHCQMYRNGRPDLPVLAVDVKSASVDSESLAICVFTPGVMPIGEPSWLQVQRSAEYTAYYIEKFAAHSSATILFAVPQDCKLIEFSTLATARAVRTDHTIEFVERIQDIKEFAYVHLVANRVGSGPKLIPERIQVTRSFDVPSASSYVGKVLDDVLIEFDGIDVGNNTLEPSL